MVKHFSNGGALMHVIPGWQMSERQNEPCSTPDNATRLAYDVIAPEESGIPLP